MLVVGESSSKYIDGFSKDFMDGFMALLSRRFVLLPLRSPTRSPKSPRLTSTPHSLVCNLRYNTKRVRANQVYQEYIQDKEHIHMNSTKWITLTEFVKHLGKEGLARVDDTEKGWFIAWVDNSPAAMARQVRFLPYITSFSLLSGD
jgi:DNA/RNA-binding protein KIN17